MCFPQILFWFQKITSEPLENCDFVDSQYHSWISPYKTRNNLDYLQIENVKVNPQRNRSIVVPTLYSFSKTESLSDYLSALWSCIDYQANTNG